MDDMVFVLMWLYGLVITASVSYLSLQVLESWFLRHIKFHVIFGAMSLTIQLAGLTLFSYWASTASHILDAMMYTALFHTFSAGIIWCVKRYLHICNLS